MPYVPNPLKPNISIRNTCFNTLKLCISHAGREYLCVSYGSHNKQGLFHQTALIGRAL
jgi:hypothetical protein